MLSSVCAAPGRKSVNKSPFPEWCGLDCASTLGHASESDMFTFKRLQSESKNSWRKGGRNMIEME